MLPLLFYATFTSANATMYGKSYYSNRFQYQRYRKFNHYRRGRYGAINGVKRSQVPTKITRQEVAKIAKKVVTKDAEMKMFNNTYNSSLTQGAWYVTNLWSGWTQNVSSQGHIGEKVSLQGMRFRVRFACNASSGGSGAVYRFMVFKTSQQLTTSTSAAVLQGNIFRTNPTLFEITAMPDSSQVDVIVDRTGVINPNTTSTTQGNVDFFSIDVPFKRVLHTLGENNSYFKEDNYYVYFGMAQDNGSVATAGFVNFGWEMDYTDD